MFEYKDYERMTLKMIRHLAKKEYELDIPYAKVRDKLRRHKMIKLISRNRSTNSAGAIGFTYNKKYWQFDNDLHSEYKAYEKDPVIGDIAVNDNEDHLMIICAHEAAHYIQYTWARKQKRFRGKWEKPHGKCFQTLYRYLRRDLVNPTIKAKAS